MTTQRLIPDTQPIQEIAEEYRQRGYRVTIGPSSAQLPEFLRDYKPALIAEGPDDSVVVAAGSGNAEPQSARWAELAKTIQQHPGWRLELLVGGGNHDEPPSTIDHATIREHLQDGLQLKEAGMLEAALLLTWLATEAALRLAAAKHRIQMPDYRTATVIGRLYTEGLIDRDDYELLMQSMRVRNQVAHGFRSERIEVASMEELGKVAVRVLPAS